MNQKNEVGVENVVIRVVSPKNCQYYPPVSVYSGTIEKIRDAHPNEFARLPEVYKTIEDPEKIYQSRTDPERSLVLTNSEVTSTGGDQLRVIVKKVSNTEAIMKSAYFSGSNNHGKLLWEKAESDQADN